MTAKHRHRTKVSLAHVRERFYVLGAFIDEEVSKALAQLCGDQDLRTREAAAQALIMFANYSKARLYYGSMADIR
jgi:HEAT repeat protein